VTIGDIVCHVVSDHTVMSAPVDTAAANPRIARRNSEALGEILWLFAHSPMHRRMRLFDLQRFVLPALKHDRYRIYKRNGMPIGYVGIARLSQEVEDLWLAGGYVLQPDDWVSGDRLWIMHFVTPFGDTLAVRKKLWLEPELRRRPIWGLRPNKSGPGLKVVQFGKYRFRDRGRSTKRMVNTGQPAQPPRRAPESTLDSLQRIPV
jgi:hemolysin-activating ACP:hemolysin acyltransferase